MINERKGKIMKGKIDGCDEKLLSEDIFGERCAFNILFIMLK